MSADPYLKDETKRAIHSAAGTPSTGSTTEHSDTSNNTAVATAQSSASSTTTPTVTTAQPSASSTTIYPVKSLTSQLAEPWAFVCRVVSRSPIREYTNIRGPGRLCELYTTDSAGDNIKVTLFNDAITQFYDVVAPGTPCNFSLGRIKLAAFAPAGSTYEATFGANADIHEVQIDNIVSNDPDMTFTPLDEVAALKNGSFITLASIIYAIGKIKRITTAKGKPLDKREFAIVDDSNTKIFCTSWGALAREISDDYEGRAVIVVGAQVSDYNGSRSLNIGLGASVLHDPTTSRADTLRAWYSNLGADHKCVTFGG